MVGAGSLEGKAMSFEEWTVEEEVVDGFLFSSTTAYWRIYEGESMLVRVEPRVSVD